MFFYKAVMCTRCALIACTATSFYMAERVHGVDAYSSPQQEFWENRQQPIDTGVLLLFLLLF